jgi:dihydrofolate reductase
MRLTPPSAEYFRHVLDTVGAIVVGRRLFDITNGWEGRHPIDVPVFVVTHEPPTDWKPRAPNPQFEFVTEGVAAAIEQAAAAAGEKAVAVNGGEMARQALEAGLIDEIWVDLVPVLLGGGTPLFDRVKSAPISLEGPISVVEGKSVTHLRYRVRR